TDHDTVINKKLYERFGVKEYWIVDPATKATWGYWLTENGYQQIISEVGKLNSVLLGDVVEF
ncbi:MAG TPA: Uma2 family endonuclease, partial [Cyclobacteriaceae bacterium]|nr:Uma2 family endonuclease [Cyclobacteriaceae bacterium]